MDKDALPEAVNALIRSPDAHELFDALTSALPLARRVEIRLSGDAAVLNELLRLAVKDAPAYEGVLELVERKRRELGVVPLVPDSTKGFDKTSYMREFMDAKRERERRAAKIENMKRRPQDQLRGRARLDFMQRCSASWKVQRDMVLAKAREANGGTLSKEALSQILDRFWANVDAALDEDEARARKLQLEPVNRRATMDQLESVLRHDPYAK